MWPRDRPTWFGPGPMRIRTLVAMTSSSRGSLSFFNAWPSSISASPSEYTSAVSMKLTPASNAALTCASTSASPSWPIGLPSSLAAVGHGAEADFRDQQARTAEKTIVHKPPPKKKCRVL